MINQVIVTLSAFGSGNGDLIERRIVLTEATPTLQIGRASKVPSKGLAAEVDNAWFDSPVMSREHAKIVANFKDLVRTSSFPQLQELC
jgi:hypothetical protein